MQAIENSPPHFDIFEDCIPVADHKRQDARWKFYVKSKDLTVGEN